jgi:hypothetical protein
MPFSTLYMELLTKVNMKLTTYKLITYLHKRQHKFSAHIITTRVATDAYTVNLLPTALNHDVLPQVLFIFSGLKKLPRYTMYNYI